MKNKTIHAKVFTDDRAETWPLLKPENAAELAANLAEIWFDQYIDEVLRICRQYDHPGCNAGSHELARKIQTVLAIFDEVRADELDELALRGSAENE